MAFEISRECRWFDSNLIKVVNLIECSNQIGACLSMMLARDLKHSGQTENNIDLSGMLAGSGL
jgi:hypothetical protein